MPVVEYILKFSIWIIVSWLFYRALLSKLTFHNWNRAYLLFHAGAAFLIPFVNISPLLYEQEIGKTAVAHIPAVQEIVNINASGWQSGTDWLMVFIVAGTIVATARLLYLLLSFSIMKNRATLLASDGPVKIYHSPGIEGSFSFANAIFLNPAGHTDEEVEKILRHEIVHVRQKHTVDLIIGEMICVINWYNPFAWLLRKSIRQNLEFIADSKVLASGLDRVQYQYLLLKVTTCANYNLATHFNISDLKKRIAMMNKLKSAKLHLARFLFILPLLALLLFSFRTSQLVFSDTAIAASIDSLPPNEKGYHLSVISSGGETYVVIKGSKDRSPRLMPMDEWKSNIRENEEKYGKLAPPAPPTPPVPPAPPAPSSWSGDEPPPVPPAPPKAPAAPVAPLKEDNNARTMSKGDRESLQAARAALREQSRRLQSSQASLKAQAASLSKSQAHIEARQQSFATEHQRLQQARAALEQSLQSQRQERGR